MAIDLARGEIVGGAKIRVAFLLGWFLLLAHHPAAAQGIHERYEALVAKAIDQAGIAQIRTINLGVNELLNETHFWLDSPETEYWRSVDQILDSPYRDNCKDFVTLKEAALRQIGIPSERVPVMLRNGLALHVVLKIQFEGRELILDNLRSVMVSMDDLKDVYETYNAAP